LSVLLAAVASGAAVLLVTSGVASGSSSSAQYEYGHPAPTKLPEISGTAQVGQKLTTTNGDWSSNTTITQYTYVWGRCDSNGNNCGAIGGATSNSYTLTSADQGHTIRSFVTARNSAGTTEARSGATAVVAGTTTNRQIDAANVKLPNRLIVEKVQYNPSVIRSRKTPTQMRIHITDSNNNSVSGARVFVEGLPYSRVANMPEVSTDSSGWATVSLQPGKLFPRTGYVVLFVRARVLGQDLLGGTSTRRLVQVTIAAPNGS
jgi:hypothetical protein